MYVCSYLFLIQVQKASVFINKGFYFMHNGIHTYVQKHLGCKKWRNQRKLKGLIWDGSQGLCNHNKTWE